MSAEPSTLDQKKTVQDGEEASGSSPNNIKKPDATGFMTNFSITTLQTMFYVGIIGTMGAYTVKTAVAKLSRNCGVELFSLANGAAASAVLNDCKNNLGPKPPFLNAAKTSVIAHYYSKVFADVFSGNTSFIDTFSNIMGNLPNWATMLIASALSIPFFIVLWLYNWLSNIYFAVQQLPLLFSEKANCKPDPTLLSSGVKRGCDANAWTKGSFFSWKIIPVGFYLMFIGLTTFFSSLYTTFTSLFTPLTLKFMLNSKKYGFSDFIQDMMTTNRPMWLILFSLILLSSTNAYLGGVYTGAALIAILVAYMKM